MFSKPLIVLSLMFLHYTSMAQIRFKCCSQHFVIPNFKEDSAMSFNQSLLVKNKVIPSITKSNASLEIRFYLNDLARNESTIIIRCKNKFIYIEKYTSVVSFDRQAFNGDSSYKVTAAFKDGSYVFTSNISKESYPANSFWIQFFNKLIQNHLFDIPSEEEYVRIVEKSHPNLPGLRESRLIIELKVNHHYRNLLYQTSFDPEPTDLAISRYKTNILAFYEKLYSNKLNYK